MWSWERSVSEESNRTRYALYQRAEQWKCIPSKSSFASRRRNASALGLIMANQDRAELLPVRCGDLLVPRGLVTTNDEESKRDETRRNEIHGDGDALPLCSPTGRKQEAMRCGVAVPIPIHRCYLLQCVLSTGSIIFRDRLIQLGMNGRKSVAFSLLFINKRASYIRKKEKLNKCIILGKTVLPT